MRKAAQARPAPIPNRLVNVEAIQSVESALVLVLLVLLLEEAAFCCSAFTETGVFGCSDEVVLSC